MPHGAGCDPKSSTARALLEVGRPQRRVFASRFQFRRFVDVVVSQDALLGNTRRRLGMCTTRGALLLEHDAQLICLPALFVELGLKLFELCQLCLPRRRA